MQIRAFLLKASIHTGRGMDLPFLSIILSKDRRQYFLVISFGHSPREGTELPDRACPYGRRVHPRLCGRGWIIIFTRSAPWKTQANAWVFCYGKGEKWI